MEIKSSFDHSHHHLLSASYNIGQGEHIESTKGKSLPKMCSGSADIDIFCMLTKKVEECLQNLDSQKLPVAGYLFGGHDM